MWVRSLGWEDPLEEEMAAHSSFLAWKIPWTEKPGELQPWRHKESDTTEHTCLRIEKSPVRASGEGLTPSGEMQQCLPEEQC